MVDGPDIKYALIELVVDSKLVDRILKDNDFTFAMDSVADLDE